MSVLVANEIALVDVPLPRSWDEPALPRWAGVAASVDVLPAVVAEPAPRRTARQKPTPPQAPKVPRARAAHRSSRRSRADATPRTAAGRLADLALTLAALLGLLVLGITVTAHATGLRPLVVKSGSMEPTIQTGGMVLVRDVPAADLRVGDVVAVDRPDNTRVTHRIVEVVPQGRTAQLTLKGDANEDVDPQPVVTDRAGRLVLSLPSVGRVSAFLASAKGGFVLGCLVTAVALPVLRRRDPAS